MFAGISKDSVSGSHFVYFERMKLDYVAKKIDFTYLVVEHLLYMLMLMLMLTVSGHLSHGRLTLIGLMVLTVCGLFGCAFFNNLLLMKPSLHRHGLMIIGDFDVTFVFSLVFVVLALGGGMPQQILFPCCERGELR